MSEMLDTNGSIKWALGRGLKWKVKPDWAYNVIGLRIRVTAPQNLSSFAPSSMSCFLTDPIKDSKDFSLQDQT